MSQLDMTEVYKMENESDGVTDTADNQKLCEFCMQLVGNDFTYIYEEEIASIQKIFPEMNMNIVKNPVVCTQCCDSLSTYNVFRKKCFNVDEKIENINEISTECKPIDELPRDLFIKSECLDEELEMSLKSEPIEIKLEENGVESNTPFSLNDETTKNSNCKNTDKAHENASETCDQPDFINKWKRKVSEECEYKSKSKSNVTIDTTKAKDRNIVYKCDMCDYKTKRQYLLGKHQLEHEKYLEVDTSLQVHNDFSKVQMYMCDSCDFRNKCKSKLIKHQVKHKDFSEVQTYMCDTCDYITKRKDNLVSHQLKHKDISEVQTYKCDVCDYMTKYKWRLVNHQLVHKDFSEVQIYMCDSCDFKTKFKSNLIKHELKHKDFSEVLIYKCDACDYRTIRKHHLISHQLKHKDFSEVPTYKCDKCDYRTKRKYCLMRHELKHKDFSEVQIYTCELCDYRAKHKKNLKRHQVKHSEVRHTSMIHVVDTSSVVT